MLADILLWYNNRPQDGTYVSKLHAGWQDTYINRGIKMRTAGGSRVAAMAIYCKRRTTVSIVDDLDNRSATTADKVFHRVCTVKRYSCRPNISEKRRVRLVG